MVKATATAAGVFLLVAALAAISYASALVSETDGLYLRIILESRSEEIIANGGEWKGEWKYAADGDGAVEEVSFEEYFGAVEKELNKNADDDTFILPDYPVPGGYVEFYFKGVRPGVVDLSVKCEMPGLDEPLADAKFRIAVFSDLKMNLFGSSEKYNWDDM